MTLSPLTVEDMDNLRHMLGITLTHPQGYRNFFVAGAADTASMERLRAHGLVILNERHTGSVGPCYHATLQGARFLGLTQLPD